MEEDPTRPLAQLNLPVEASLRIAFQGRELECDRENPVIRFGRSQDNDLIVDDQFVSRRHGEILHRNGRFFVTDHSSNGTLLVRAAGQTTHFQGETFALDGAGSLCCGHRDGPPMDFVVTPLGGSRGFAHEPAEPDPEPAGGNCFYREGDYWTLAYEGSLLRLKHAKGLGYLAQLLRHPDREIHVLDLVTGDMAPLRSVARREYDVDLASDSGSGAGAHLDAAARAQYQNRVRELREEIAHAESCNDPGRTAAAQAELEFIADQLAGSIGLGGRDREAASNAERARVAVTLAIKASLEKLRNCHPALGAHLRMTIKRGRFCSYQPDPTRPVEWKLDR